MKATEAFPRNRFGLTCDPRGAHVTLDYAGRHYLGEIVSVRHDEVRGCWLAQVRHFNGSVWPIEPRLYALTVLERV